MKTISIVAKNCNGDILYSTYVYHPLDIGRIIDQYHDRVEMETTGTYAITIVMHGGI